MDKGTLILGLRVALKLKRDDLVQEFGQKLQSACCQNEDKEHAYNGSSAHMRANIIKIIK